MRLKIKNLTIISISLLLAACSTTGTGFNASGISQITVGETTIEQASEYLKAKPVDTWRQGDSTLSRWAYKGTMATDAIYLRKEAWLRFGSDGTFQRIEKTINIPGIYTPKQISDSQPKKQDQRWEDLWEAQKDGAWIEVPAGDTSGVEVLTIK